jgi:hypothetical protein
MAKTRAVAAHLCSSVLGGGNSICQTKDRSYELRFDKGSPFGMLSPRRSSTPNDTEMLTDSQNKVVDDHVPERQDTQPIDLRVSYRPVIRMGWLV